MCGRYHMGKDTAEKAGDALGVLIEEKGGVAEGDVYPSETALILKKGENGIQAASMKWGFPSSFGKGLVINARAETVLEKKMFSENVRRRRCAVLGDSYYEWDREKNKAEFSRKDKAVLFMAGFYQMYEDGEHFVIITTKANPSVEKTHDRMPLILDSGEVKAWIEDDDMLKTMLRKETPLLDKKQEYEQITFSFINGGERED